MPVLVAILVVLVAPVLIVALMYNSLVTLRNMCDEAWSNIDTELKRRYDLIPNLVETVKGYAAHERQVLQRVAELRARAVQSTGSPQSQARDENELVRALRSLFVVVERYPELKASRQFLELQRELALTEDRIQAARRFYNANVRDFNSRIQVFPSNLVAGAFQFAPREFFEIEDVGVRAAPEVRL